MTMHLPDAVVQMVKVAAQHPEGLAPLFEGDLECVAALYQVHPSLVERARELVCTPEGRAAAGAYALSVAPRRHAPTAHRPQPLDVGTLIAEAAIFPDGIALLTDAPVEMAAIRLQAHPFLIEEARAWLASRRQAHAPPGLVPLAVPTRPSLTGDRAS